MKYKAGCKLSPIDGHEHIFKTNVSVPLRFTLRPIMPPVVDQGQTSKCVAYSLASYLDWKKNSHENDKNGNQFNVDQIYMMRKNNDDGMDIKDGLSILRKIGNNGFKIKEYAKVNSILHLKMALLLNGPCLCAMPVKSDASHFWSGNKLLGYHCLLITGYDEKSFELRNSWGTSWGDKGYTKISFDDFEKNVLEIWTIIS